MEEREPGERAAPGAAARPPAILSGVPGFDRVLGGGLPPGALVMVVGPPGSGKTTLAAQIAFAAARDGRRALLLTTLSESSNKLIDHLRGFRFFDEAVIGDRVQVFSLQPFLSQGLERTADELVGAARQVRADIVVLDGFRGLRSVATVPLETREFLYTVGGRLAVLGMTTIITSESEPRDTTLYPEATTADVIIGLHYRLEGVRHQRGLEAIKVRGAAPLSGLHGFAIDGSGVVVYPRLEARVAGRPVVANQDEAPDDASVDAGRARFDLPELDCLISGGLNHQTRTLVVGRLGTGKTLLALHFALAGVRAGEAVLYIGFRESRRQLLQKADLFGLGADMRAALAPGGGLTLLRLPPVELDPDYLGTRILGALDETGARRLIVDSIVELERAVVGADARRLDDYLAALVENLRARGVTSLFTKELRQILAGTVDFVDDHLALLTENVILLRQLEFHSRLHRILAVLKMSFSNYDPSLREFTIASGEGLRVLTAEESSGGVLAGIAREDIAQVSPLPPASEPSAGGTPPAEKTGEE